MSVDSLHVETRIKRWNSKADGASNLVECHIPESKRLFEVIYGFHQLETVEVPVDLDTFRDRAEDLFLHHAIHERRNNVNFIQVASRYTLRVLLQPCVA